MGDSETAQQGSAGEHAGDVTDNGHAGDVADDEVVGAVPPGAFGPAATSSLQDSLLLMSTEHSNHGSTSSTSPSDVMSTVLAKRHPASALSLAAVLQTVGQICTAPRRSADCTAPLPLRTADHPPALPPESPSTLYVSPVGCVSRGESGPLWRQDARCPAQEMEDGLMGKAKSLAAGGTEKAQTVVPSTDRH